MKSMFSARPAVVAAALVLMAAAAAGAAPVSRSFTREFPVGSETLRLMNLIGHVEVVAGEGAQVRVVATAHAEDAGGAAASQALLDGLRWVEERHDGQKSWWLSYPVDQHRQFRNLPESSRRSTQTAHYRGRHVRIQSGGNGPLLYVDLRIEVPAGARLGVYNRVGPARAQGVEARLRLDTGSGEVHVRDHVGDFTGDTGSGSIDAAALRGTVSLDTGSGNVTVQGVQGDLEVDTGSGSVTIREVEGGRVSADTGSGRVEARGVRADLLVADTGSGAVVFEDVDAARIEADTGSGSVRIAGPFERTRQIEVDTGSGGVVLRGPAGFGFRLTADQGSGDLDSGYADARPLIEGRRVIGYERGDGRTRILVDTGSGNCRIEPME